MPSQFVPSTTPASIVSTNTQWTALEIAASGSPSPSGLILIGDAIGELENNSVIRINSNPLGSTDPANGNILIADGSQWNSTHPSGTVIITASGSIYLQNTGVAPGTYGSTTMVSQVTIGPDGRVISASSVPIDISGVSSQPEFRRSMLLMGG